MTRPRTTRHKQEETLDAWVEADRGKRRRSVLAGVKFVPLFIPLVCCRQPLLATLIFVVARKKENKSVFRGMSNIIVLIFFFKPII